MKVLYVLFLLFVTTKAFAGYSQQQAVYQEQKPNTDSMKLKITVGQTIFRATLNNSKTATAFKNKLPLSVNMADLNGNEKHVDLAPGLPTNASNPGSIQTGDLMLYGAGTLVLFYKSFPTSYSYTRIGHIDDTNGLATAVGSGNVTVKFELEQ